MRRACGAMSPRDSRNAQRVDLVDVVRGRVPARHGRRRRSRSRCRTSSRASGSRATSRPLVTAAVRDATGAPLDVRLPRRCAGRGARPGGRRAGPARGGRPAAAPAHGARVPDAAHPLTGKYTFDHFVIGSSNRFAHAAALAVAEAPAQAYNPLFIYGATGLGKTHLLQAISHYLATETSALRARYLTGEAFMNDFIAHLQDKRLDEFKTRLPDVRRPADRRHPVLRRERAHPGRVFPHLQQRVRGRRTNRPVVRPAAEGDQRRSRNASVRGSSGA